MQISRKWQSSAETRARARPRHADEEIVKNEWNSEIENNSSYLMFIIYTVMGCVFRTPGNRSPLETRWNGKCLFSRLAASGSKALEGKLHGKTLADKKDGPWMQK